MKRILAVCLTVAMTLSLSSCFLLPDVVTMQWQSFEVAPEDLHKGTLVPVNTDNPYVAPADNSHLAPISDVWKSHVPAVYHVSETAVYMESTALAALDSMLADFAKVTKKDNVIIQSAYLSPEELGDLPADHLTGLGCQLKFVTLDEEGATVTHNLSEDEAYNWFFENHHKYGFVIRYPADKDEVTGVSEYADYFRYVGAPHAEYMKENNLCLEEYIELLKGYTAMNTLSVYTNGQHYKLYFASVSESFTIEYPAFHSYTYSGVGKDGIVVILRD